MTIMYSRPMKTALKASTDRPRPQNEYLVEWRIEVTAANPEAAARKALEIQRDRNSLATVFDVMDGVETVQVDLTGIDNEVA